MDAMDRITVWEIMMDLLYNISSIINFDSIQKSEDKAKAA